MSKPQTGICVDGSACPNPGVIQWQGLDLGTGKPLFRSKPYQTASNNIAEFLAIVHALASTPNQETLIYSDSQTARVWAKKGYCSMDSVKGDEVKQLVVRAVDWLKANPLESARVWAWETKNWGENPADFGRK